MVGFWVSWGFGQLLEPFTFNSRLGFYFNVSQAWKGEVLGLSGVR